MTNLTSYIPNDRRLALSRGTSLPDRTQGTALFADISGFTLLTEGLANELGPQRGAEELSKHLNHIYGEIIEQVEKYLGSVISFNGDAISCWFDQDPGQRAAACAIAMQESMRTYASIATPGGAVYPIAIKVGISNGPARRFQVGDPEIQFFDILAGETIDRLAEAEHHAERGEVVVGEEVAESLGADLDLREWRTDPYSGERFGVVSQLNVDVEAPGWPLLFPNEMSEQVVRPWILRGTYERVKSGVEAFQSELRPVVALFLSFRGIDYDCDPYAGEKLDAFIRWVQNKADRYDGALLQITFGDKGGYLYITFGAPFAHEDDVDRAVLTALQLRTGREVFDTIQNIQIGISKGRMRVGPYGAITRRTYGVLGDHTNLAARLMQHAPDGMVYVSSEAMRDSIAAFEWEELPPLKVKGKTEPIKVYLLKGLKPRRSALSQRPGVLLPIVGRQNELRIIDEKISLAGARHGQIVAIAAEAGLGKSRLVIESMRRASARGLDIFYGECQSYGVNTSYLVWQSIWQDFFNLDLGSAPAEQIQAVESRLGEIDPLLPARLPLLSSVLNLPIPDNALTNSMDPKLRKESLEALLVDCLRFLAQSCPILFVLEDSHWMDPISNELLGAIGRVITNLPVMILMAFRPLELQRMRAFEISELPYYSELCLDDFTAEEAQQLITLKFSELQGSTNEYSAELIRHITERAQGNPFYIEELVHYLNDRKIDTLSPEKYLKLDLPNSLHSLILSRIDQLRERQKIILKVASVIGRTFRVGWLWGVDPDLGKSEDVLADLEELSSLDITPKDQPEPVLTYIFKHIVTREVAYESMPFATRALLHGKLGYFIESSFASEIPQFVDLLAYHFDLSQETDKKREYLSEAGKAAQTNYANSAATDYYLRLLKILPQAEKAPVLFNLGQVYELVGEWSNARESYSAALEIAVSEKDDLVKVGCQLGLGSLARKQGDYGEAAEWLSRARIAFEAKGKPSGISQVLSEYGDLMRIQGKYSAAESYFQESLQQIGAIRDASARQAAQAAVMKSMGTLANQRGDPAQARSYYEQALKIARQIDNRVSVASLLNNLGMVALFKEEYAAAQPLFEESLAIFREIGSRWAVGQLLNNLGLVMRYRGEIGLARAWLEESVEIRRALGDKWGIANSLSTLSNLLIHQKAFDEVEEPLTESLKLNAELGDQTAIVYCLEDFASLAAGKGDFERAMQIAGAASVLRQSIGCPLPPGEQSALDSTLIQATSALNEASRVDAWEAGKAMTLEEAIRFTLM